MKIKFSVMSVLSVITALIFGSLTPAMASSGAAELTGLVVTNVEVSSSLARTKLWPDFDPAYTQYETVTWFSDIHVHAQVDGASTVSMSLNGGSSTSGEEQDFTLPIGKSSISITVTSGANTKDYLLNVSSKSADAPKIISISPNTGNINGGDEVEVSIANLGPESGDDYNWNTNKYSRCSHDFYFRNSASKDDWAWAGQISRKYDESTKLTKVRIVVPQSIRRNVYVSDVGIGSYCRLQRDTNSDTTFSNYSWKLGAYSYTDNEVAPVVTIPDQVTIGSGIQVQGEGFNAHSFMDEEAGHSVRAVIIDPETGFSSKYTSSNYSNTYTGNALWLNSWLYSSNDTANLYIPHFPDKNCTGGRSCDDFISQPGPRTFAIVKCVDWFDWYTDSAGRCDYANPIYSKTINWVSPSARNVSFSPTSSGLAGRGIVANVGGVDTVTKGLTVRGRNLYFNDDGDAYYGVRFPGAGNGTVQIKSLAGYVNTGGNNWREGDSDTWGGEYGNYITSRAGDYISYTTGSDVFAVQAPPAPAATAGPLVITGWNELTSTTSAKYTYAKQPVISSVTPASASASGGSLITLTGSGFGTSGVPSVTINGQKAPCVTRVSDTKVVAMVPAFDPAVAIQGAEVSILPATGAGAPQLPGSINLTAPATGPTVTAPSSATPAAVLTTGGQSITVTGSGFGTSTTVGVTVSGQCAKVTAATSNSVTFEVPSASAAGRQDLVIASSAGTTTVANAISYTAPDGISNVSPARISAAAGEVKLTITGTGLGTSGTVKIGDQTAVAYESDGTTISDVAFTPASAGSVQVAVTPQGSASALTSSISVQAPTISYVGPEYAGGSPVNEYLAPSPNDSSRGKTFPVEAGTVIRIDGTNFGTSAGTVRVGDTDVTPDSWSDTVITIAAPGSLAAGTYSVKVIPASGSATVTRTVAVSYTETLISPVISGIHRQADHGSADFDQLNLSDSDLFVIEGENLLGTEGANPVVKWIDRDTYEKRTVAVVSATDTEVVIHAPRGITRDQLSWNWPYFYLALHLEAANGDIYAYNAINYLTYGGVNRTVNQYGSVCLRTSDESTVQPDGTPYQVASLNIMDADAFGEGSVTATVSDSKGAMALDSSAIDKSDSSHVNINFANLTDDSLNLDRPWGQKTVTITNADGTTTHTYGLSCRVSPTVTTTVDGASSATFEAGTALLEKVSWKAENAAPFLATSITAPLEYVGAATKSAFEYTTVAAYDSGHKYVSDFPGAKSGLPVAAGDYYIRVVPWSSSVKYDSNYYIMNAPYGTANFAHVTLTGKNLTLTPKLKGSSANTIEYGGALTEGDFEVTNVGGEPLESVFYEYKHTSCSGGWVGGLPAGVSVAPGSGRSGCTGSAGDADSWDIRVASFTMGTNPGTGLDKSLGYYWPTSMTNGTSGTADDEHPIFTLTVTKKSVSIQSVSASRVWDGTTDVKIDGLELIGAAEGDIPTISPDSIASAKFASSDAGSGIAITHDTFVLNSDNYILTNGDIALTGNILKADATLEVTINPAKFCGSSFPCELVGTVVTADSGTNAEPAEGNGLGDPSFSTSGASGCSASYDSGTGEVTVTTQAAGACVLTGTQAGSKNYNTVVSASDSSSTREVKNITFIGQPKSVSVVADDVITDYQSIIDNGGLEASAQVQGLLGDDEYNTDGVTYDFVKGSTHKTAAELAELCATPADCMGTWSIVPSGGEFGVVADSSAYLSKINYVAGKLIITNLPPVITQIDSASGPEEGGNVVTISGTGFSAVTSLTIGDLVLRKPDITVVGSTTIIFTAPAGRGVVDLTLTAGDATASGIYTYIPPSEPDVTLTSVSPTHGLDLGGNKITVTGTHLEQVLQVKVGTITLGSSSFKVNGDGTELTFTMPAGSGTKTISLVANWNTVDQAYVYDPTITVDISPKHGLDSGGNTITATGKNLNLVSEIHIGSAVLNSSKFTVNGAGTQITFTMPSGSGTETVTFVATWNSVDVSYDYDPTITVDISPKHGLDTGGNTITATGTNLDLVSEIHVGSIVISSGDFTVNGAGTEITFTMPAGSGTKTVSFIATWNTVNKSYVYDPTITVDISPKHGLDTGGNTITATGTNLDEVSEIRVGSTVLNSSKFTVNGAGTQITFTMPAGSGTKTVTFVATWNSVDVSYDYDPTLNVTSLTPQLGDEEGGFTVTATGINLDQVTEIHLGSLVITAEEFDLNEAGTQITFTMPPGVGKNTVTFIGNFNNDSIFYTYKPSQEPELDLNLQLDIGAELSGAEAVLSGGGLKARSRYTLVMHSKTVVVYSGISDANGNFKQKIHMPQNACVNMGKHELVLTGIAPDGSEVSSTQYLALDDKCHLLVKSKKPIKTISSARISGFLFGYDSYKLTAHAKASLRGLRPFLAGAKVVTITGYTQTNLHSAESRRANLILAKRRTMATAAYLRSLGIKVRMVLVAKGATNPVSIKRQELNRRVNIVIGYLK